MHSLDNTWKDLRFALRQLAKRPGFTATAVGVLALGLGANATIFSVINAVLLEPLPFVHPEKLMSISERNVIPNAPYNSVAPGNYLDWQRDSRTFQQIAASKPVQFNLSSKGEAFTPQRIYGAACSANLFQTLGVAPELGRNFRSEEDRKNAPPVALISDGLWKQRFAGSRAVLQRQIRLNDVEYSIIGVMPANIRYPNRQTQVWVSMKRYMPSDVLESHDNHQLSVVGRLRPGKSAADGEAEISSFVQRYHKTHPAAIVGQGATVIRLDSYLTRNVAGSLWILFGTVGCLLMIACVNIANLLLTRALGRQRELAIRAAVGASRAQIICQLLIESVTISLAGACVGLLLAIWGTPVLAAHAPGADYLPQAGNIQINYAVLLFTTMLALAAGMIAGLLPAISASRADLINGLKEGGRSNTSSHSHAGTRNILIAGEVAISAMLLIGAGLLLRSFAQLQHVHTGVRAENTITMGVSLPDVTYQNRAAIANFSRVLAERVRSLHDVESSGLVSFPPLAGHDGDEAFRIEGHPLPPGQMMDLSDIFASPEYFKAAGIPLIAGRLFTPQDNRGYNDQHPQVDPALISESTAKRFFAGMNPIGQFLDYGTDAGALPAVPGHPYPRIQIVGIVGDVLENPDRPVRPAIYFPLLDGDSNDIYIVAHTKGNPDKEIAALRNTIQRLDPSLPVHDIRSIGQIAAESVADRQFSLVLLSLFALLALILAAVGLYGVVSYGVSQRISEIGIRMALGATRTSISRTVLLHGMKPALAGVVTGLIGAALLTRTLQSMLFGVGAVDPITFVTVPLVLLLVIVLACTIPALRACRVDPLTALRIE